MDQHPPRYPGTRWRILYAAPQAIEQYALVELQRVVQAYLPYVIEVHPADVQPAVESHVILLGTPATHPRIAELVARGLPAPEAAEGYTLACLASPWPGIDRMLVVAGADPKGMLNGVVDLAGKVLARQPATGDPRAVLDGLPDFTLCEAPAIANRGIWTWGYVIYDYRRFLDNMARLKMNVITVWNDCPPLNSREFIAAAHARGIRVIFGYHWGWGRADLDPNDPVARARIKAEVLDKYRREYRDLGLDGIYFQTFTEQVETRAGGRTIAALACEWVNDIAGALLDEAPGLRIEFGLHASSIAGHYRDLAPLDPRVVIVWEDAGVLPYAYDPVVEAPPAWVERMHGLHTFEATLAYSLQLAALRPGAEFAQVAKGFTCLDWEQEFEHHGPFILGERDPGFITRRLQARQARWDAVYARWQEVAPYARRFYQALLATRPTAMTVQALIEDGLLEETLPPAAALFAAILWNPREAGR